MATAVNYSLSVSTMRVGLSSFRFFGCQQAARFSDKRRSQFLCPSEPRSPWIDTDTAGRNRGRDNWRHYYGRPTLGGGVTVFVSEKQTDLTYCCLTTWQVVYPILERRWFFWTGLTWIEAGTNKPRKGLDGLRSSVHLLIGRLEWLSGFRYPSSWYVKCLYGETNRILGNVSVAWQSITKFDEISRYSMLRLFNVVYGWRTTCRLV